MSNFRICCLSNPTYFVISLFLLVMLPHYWPWQLDLPCFCPIWVIDFVISCFAVSLVISFIMAWVKGSTFLSCIYVHATRWFEMFEDFHSTNIFLHYISFIIKPLTAKPSIIFFFLSFPFFQVNLIYNICVYTWDVTTSFLKRKKIKRGFGKQILLT